MAEVLSLAVARERRRARSEEPWVSKREIARLLGYHTKSIERFMRAGMPFMKRFPQSHPRFQRSECEAWLQERRP
jgi:predicted DNA-binding transcriptional regulator AlpA